MKERGTWHLPVPLLEVLVYLISSCQKQSAWRRFPINRDKCGAKHYWLRSPSELGNLQMSVQNWEIKMKLPNFSATFYRLTTFLLGLKGVHRIIGDRFTVINPSNFVGSLQTCPLTLIDWNFICSSVFSIECSRVVRPASCLMGSPSNEFVYRGYLLPV